jgi:transcriptional regulator with XRE-family HTH domain
MASLWQRLRSKKFRDAFVATQFKRSIPFQITAIRKKLGWSQEQLAKAANLTQGVISRAENPDYGNLTFNSVLRMAAGLDVAVVIEFVPFSKLLRVFDSRSEDLAPATFEEEDKMLSENEAQGNQTITPEPGGLNMTGGDPTMKWGSVENSTFISPATTTKTTLKSLKPNVPPAEKVARGTFAQERDAA